jgi:flavin-dependent dehydrogenase
MKNENSIQDVLIVGGGPAGSTAASFLAMKGCRVTLLEKEKFPRDHVGESLLPFCYQLFDQLGVLDQLKATFVRKPGVRFIDGEGRSSTTWCFNHVIHNPSHLSFQVDRSKFDHVLLENARKKGANVHEETCVVSADLEDADGFVTVKAVGPDGAERTLRSRFLLDASGRDTFLATRLGQRKTFSHLDRTAFWTHWKCKSLMGGLEEGLSLIVYLGEKKKGWIWVFPLAEDHLTVGVVVNNSYIRDMRKKLQESGSESWKDDLYSQELKTSPFVCKILDGASVMGPLRVEGNYSYYVEPENKYGPRHALVGDAATFIDPIFSSGIFLSMNSSRLVSEAIHRRLHSANGDGDAAFKAAYEKINGAYRLVYRLIELFYNPEAISFAEAGAISQSEHSSHQHLMATGHFLLAGDFFDRHQEYLDFIDLLQSQGLFDNFRNFVLDRREFQALSCGAKTAEVFPPTASAVETS